MIDFTIAMTEILSVTTEMQKTLEDLSGFASSLEEICEGEPTAEKFKQIVKMFQQITSKLQSIERRMKNQGMV